jgi:AcrR family transcriptional regulator
MPHIDDDRRVRRTKALLHRALGSLIHEKPWDDIGVKQILGRADVGRSTFYTHFRDKDALLVSALRDILRLGSNTHAESAGPVEQALRFSLPLLEHIEYLRGGTAATRVQHNYSALHERLRPALVEMIAAKLATLTPSPALVRPALPLDLVAQHLASTFLLTLEWWIGLPDPLPAREVDEVFRRLARPVLEVSLEASPP